MNRRLNPRQFIELNPSVAKTYLKVMQSTKCGAAQELFASGIPVINIYRKGAETLLASYQAFNLDADNNLGFYWDSQLLSQPKGLYIGDVYVGTEYCFSVQFKIKGCEFMATDMFNITAPIEPCDDTIGIPVIGEDCQEEPQLDRFLESNSPSPNFYDTTDSGLCEPNTILPNFPTSELCDDPIGL